MYAKACKRVIGFTSFFFEEFSGVNVSLFITLTIKSYLVLYINVAYSSTSVAIIFSSLLNLSASKMAIGLICTADIEPSIRYVHIQPALWQQQYFADVSGRYIADGYACASSFSKTSSDGRCGSDCLRDKILREAPIGALV